MSLMEFGKELLAATDNRGVKPDELAKALSRCELKTLDTGMMVCKEGKQAEELFFLLSGHVAVVKTDPRGRLHELAALSAPALLGHMALLERTKRSATCMTKTPVELAILSRDAYDSLLYEPSGAGRALRRLLLSSLAGQLGSGNARLGKMLEPSVTKEDEAATESQLVNTSATLEGWAKPNPQSG